MFIPVLSVMQKFWTCNDKKNPWPAVKRHLKLRISSFAMPTLRLKYGLMIGPYALVVDVFSGHCRYAAVWLQCTAACSYGRSWESKGSTPGVAGELQNCAVLHECNLFNLAIQEQIAERQRQQQSLQQEISIQTSQLAILHVRSVAFRHTLKCISMLFTGWSVAYSQLASHSTARRDWTSKCSCLDWSKWNLEAPKCVAILFKWQCRNISAIISFSCNLCSKILLIKSLSLLNFVCVFWYSKPILVTCSEFRGLFYLLILVQAWWMFAQDEASHFRDLRKQQRQEEFELRNAHLEIEVRLDERSICALHWRLFRLQPLCYCLTAVLGSMQLRKKLRKQRLNSRSCRWVAKLCGTPWMQFVQFGDPGTNCRAPTSTAKFTARFFRFAVQSTCSTN